MQRQTHKIQTQRNNNEDPSWIASWLVTLSNGTIKEVLWRKLGQVMAETGRGR
jgi:hypothetical protein